MLVSVSRISTAIVAFMLGRSPLYTATQKKDSDFLYGNKSATPYKIRRVQRREALLFPVDNAASITGGLSLRDLQARGRLFSTDFSRLKVCKQDPFGFCWYFLAY